MEGGKQTEKKGCLSVTIVFIILIVILDISAGFFGLRAEAAQQDVKHKRVWLLECKAPSKTAFVLGTIALSCLAAAHVIVSVIGCHISNLLKAFVQPKITTYFNVCLYLITWIVGLAGAVALGMGIWTNRESKSECGFTNKKNFSFGSKVCFLHAIVSVVCYVSSIVAKQCWCL